MKLHLLISLCLLFVFFELDAQSPKWAKTFQGPSVEAGVSIVSDSFGNIYTAGFYRETADFNPSMGTSYYTSNGESDVFIQKMDSNGNLLWVKSFGGVGSDGPTSLCIDLNDNLYLMGYFQDTVDFDSGVGTNFLNSNGGYDAFFLKMDLSGNLLWVKSFGGIDHELDYSLKTDQYGNVYLSGSFQGTVDFDPGFGTNFITSFGGKDIIVLKMTNNGDFVWARSFGGPNNDGSFSIDIDLSGNIYTTGNFMQMADFDPGSGTFNLTSFGAEDVFIHKMDNSGSLVWAKSFGSGAYDVGAEIVVDQSNNVCISGSFKETVDFDPGTGTMNYTASSIEGDGFIQKLDSLGNFLWVKTFGGTNSSYGYHSIGIDNEGNIYSTGFFSNFVDFDPGPGFASFFGQGYGDVYVHKMDSVGNFLWVKTFGGSLNDEGYDLCVDNSGNVYITGYFQGQINFDNGMQSLNSILNDLDAIVLKLGPCVPTTIESAFVHPTSANNCLGTSALTILGDGYFELDVENGSQNTTSSGFSLLTDLCSGFHDLQIINYCGDTLSTTIVIPVDSNFVFNNPFIDSLAQDSLGVTLTNCDIYYGGIDTAYIDSIWATGNTVNVIWNIVDSNGSNFDTTSYVLNNGNGVYWLQLSVFCPNKSLGEYFTVTEAIYFNNGSVSTAGLTDIGKDLFAIYPNPTNDQVHISFSGSDAELTVYDVQGKVILKDQIQNNGTISLENFERGVYLFDFKNSQGHSVQRVVKQ